MSEIPGSPRDEPEGDPARLRTRLVEAASLIVRFRGVAALTPQDLAQAADVDVWTVMREFRTKEDILAILRLRGVI